MQPGLPGIEIDTTIFRPATFIEMSIDNLTKALLIGCLLVVLVLGAFLFEWRAALISLVAIPLSLVAAGLVLYCARRDDQHDGPGGVRDRPRGRRRRRDHRRREHRAAPAPASQRRAATSRRRRSSSRPRSRCAAPIVYATLIIVAGAAAGLLPDGPDRRVLPAAGALLRAGGAGLARGRPDRHAGAVPDPAGEGAARAPRVAARRVAAAWLRAVLAADHPQAAPGVRRRRRHRGWPAWRCCRSSGSRCCPTFKERDFLMHWMTKPGTSGPEETRISIRGQSELRAIPGVRNFGSHIGQALLDGRGRRHLLRRELDQRRSLGRLRRDARRSSGGGRRLPGALPRRADLSEGAIERC